MASSGLKITRQLCRRLNIVSPSGRNMRSARPCFKPSARLAKADLAKMVLAKADLGEGGSWRRRILAKADLGENNRDRPAPPARDPLGVERRLPRSRQRAASRCDKGVLDLESLLVGRRWLLTR